MEMNEKNNHLSVRMHNAIQYIEEHNDSKLLLEEVAQKAFLSPYHFHRIFKTITGETFNNFVIRKRIERAANFLLHSEDKSISEITDLTGFSSISLFSRTFKKFYGISPTEFKNKRESRFSKISKTKSKNGKVDTELEQYIYNMKNFVKYIDEKATNLEVVKINNILVAYVPHIGAFDNVGIAFEKLLKWAYPKGLMNGQPRIMSVYHDSPKVTEEAKLKMSACIGLENNTIDTSEINTRTISGGKYVSATFTLALHEFKKTYEAIFVWIFDKGFKVDDTRDPFDEYHNNFNEHPQKLCNLTIYIPVE